MLSKRRAENGIVSTYDFFLDTFAYNLYSACM